MKHNCVLPSSSGLTHKAEVVEGAVASKACDVWGGIEAVCAEVNAVQVRRIDDVLPASTCECMRESTSIGRADDVPPGSPCIPRHAYTEARVTYKEEPLVGCFCAIRRNIACLLPSRLLKFAAPLNNCRVSRTPPPPKSDAGGILPITSTVEKHTHTWHLLVSGLEPSMYLANARDTTEYKQY
eukprot:1147322-Pelagomonas_calceolata.AAC.20